ncbi:hypothetical protein [Rhizobium leguminosarum]|jgi:NAD(P)-dependent dehydrogenase (short-subunit alcohol dehydrogenase family)|uniref:hypothetical protein n=1 Tax=Rhizobium leguminosarum TaxID=384 RepID=UPI003511796B
MEVARGPVGSHFWNKPGGLACAMGRHNKMETHAAVEHEMKLRQLPVQSLGTPEKVANVIVYLASVLVSSVWCRWRLRRLT